MKPPPPPPVDRVAFFRAMAEKRRELAEAGKLPAAAANPPAPAGGPGTELRKLIARLGIRPAPGCQCHARAMAMDLKGADWCEANLDTIAGWLGEEATRANLPFSAFLAKQMVKLAIRRARRASIE